MHQFDWKKLTVNGKLTVRIHQMAPVYVYYISIKSKIKAKLKNKSLDTIFPQSLTK